MTVNVAPFDENQDGIPDFVSNSRNYTLFPGGTATGPITVTATRPASCSIRFEMTNTAITAVSSTGTLRYSGTAPRGKSPNRR